MIRDALRGVIGTGWLAVCLVCIVACVAACQAPPSGSADIEPNSEPQHLSPAPTGPTGTPAAAPGAAQTPRATASARSASPAPLAWDWDGVLLFTAVEVGETDLYVLDAEGGARSRLTTLGGVGRARFAPDGTQIAFERSEAMGPHTSSDIYVMRADGSGVENLTRTPALAEGAPDWSPDGTRIVFQRRALAARGSEIHVMHADGTQRSLVVDVHASDQQPAWSPDGERIAFVGYTTGTGTRWSDQGDVFVVHADGSGLTNLTQRGEHVTSPVWSLDGEELIYGRLMRLSPTEGTWQIWRMTAQGRAQRCVIACTGAPQEISSIPVAWLYGQIAFAGREGSDWDIFLGDDTGTNILQITRGGSDEKVWDWRP